VQHVNIDRTVELIRQRLAESEQVELLSRQSEISRAGVIMRRVEEECGGRIVTMTTENRSERKEEREYNVLYFRAVFARGA
jgi:hypothetical protein